MKEYSFRQKAGALLLDAPRLLWALRGSARWMHYGNRGDRLRFDPEGRGVACEWEFTRPLHLCDVFPAFGRHLLAAALRDCPIRLLEAPEETAADGLAPGVSFIVGHRGLDRLPQLLLALQSIAAQTGVSFECIVVEQDASPLVRDDLPDWVRYVHDPIGVPETPYSRSRAFNAGAALARGRVLILHDNDLLVPERYAEHAWKLVEEGFEVVNLKRFIFYRSEGIQAGQSPLAGNVESVLENATGGGSLAVARETFEALGRMDDSFEGWGGEDVEFWQRARTRRVWNCGFLPLVHLWHSDQPGKTPAKKTPGMARLEQLSEIPPERRIETLLQKGKRP